MSAFEVVICTDRGQVRPNNEDYADYYQPSDPEIATRLGSLFVVADGVGGRKAGEVASAEAVHALMQEYYFGYGVPEPAKRLQQATMRANLHVFDMSWAMAAAAQMGCTMTALLLCGGRYYISHVGDTRCYLLRSDRIRKLTSDHHTTMHPQRMNIFNRQPPGPARSFLSRAIGMEMSVRPDVSEGATAPGDRFLLTSDGVTNYMKPEELQAAFSGAADLEATAQSVIATCNRRGGGDNITVMLIAIPATHEGETHGTTTR